MFCTNCGSEMDENMVFCTNCGAKLIKTNDEIIKSSRNRRGLFNRNLMHKKKLLRRLIVIGKIDF